MNICIFEDKKYINFLPLTLSRPIFELITGTKTVREKLCQYFTKDDIFLS
ncbi:MAG: transferase, partial [Candidatus Cloacimonadota bacterium]